MWIKVDTEKDTEEEIINIVKVNFRNKTTNPQQTSLTNPDKVICERCKKDIKLLYGPDAQKIINYCTHEKQRDVFKGKIYCLDCQPIIRGDGRDAP